jgi:hypothetical protein
MATPPVTAAATAPTPPAMPSHGGGGQGNAVALYDFESQGDDELTITEGERLEFIVDGSDDAEWSKVRRVNGSGEEGVVPASYIEIDAGADLSAAPPPAAPPAAPAPPPAPPLPPANGRLAGIRPPPIRSASSQVREAENAEDEAALRAQLEADARAQKERERRAEKERRAERERRDRLRHAPKATPIPVPSEVDDDIGAPPPLAARPGKGGSSSGGGAGGSSDTKKRDIKLPNPGRTRVWKDRTGQFKVEAEFLGLNGNKIRLHKVNGVVIEVPVEKMSVEDTNYLKQLSRSRREGREGESSKRSSRTADAVRDSVQIKKPSTSSSSQPNKPRSTFDWFDFFLSAGCDVDHCTRYARNAEQEGIDETLIPDFEDSNLRGLGLKEGDVIRVKRHIKEKYARPPPTPTKDRRSPSLPESREAREAQIAADHELAQKLSRGDPIPPAPQLFSSGPDATLKPRRGRRNTAASGNSVNAGALSAAATELERNRTTSPTQAAISVPTSPAVETRKRSSSTVPIHGGFDDDAWDIKPAAAKSASSPAPAAAPSPPPAPTPPPAPPAPIPAAVAAPATATEPAKKDATAGLTYNDGLLAQLGVGPGATNNNKSSAPVQSAQPTGASGSYVSPQATGFNPNGPRTPIAPVPANQGLLAPLQPTRTGFQASQLQPQNTGFFPGATTLGVMPMATGFGGMGSMSMMSRE